MPTYLEWLTVGPLVALRAHRRMRGAGTPSASAASQGPEENSAPLLAFAVASWQQLKQYASVCPPKFAPRADLVGALVEMESGHLAAAVRLFEAAIDSARAAGFAHIEALACEEYARAVVTELQGRLLGAHLLMRACQLYVCWGASAATGHLYRDYPELLLAAPSAAAADTGRMPLSSDAMSSGRCNEPTARPHVAGQRPSSSSDTAEFTGSLLSARSVRDGSRVVIDSGSAAARRTRTNQAHLDLRDVLEYAQIMLRVLERRDIVVFTCRVLLRSAGAQRGAIVIQHDQSLYVVAEWNADAALCTYAFPDEANVAVDIPGASPSPEDMNQIAQFPAMSREEHSPEPLSADRRADSVPLRIVRGVVATGQAWPPSGPDAALQTELSWLSEAPLAAQSRYSVLVLPISTGGRTMGAVFLANPLTTTAFPQPRVRMLSLFIGQMALSLRNAALFYQVARQEQELRRTNEHLRQMDKMKDDFVANTSHELRTPLNAIIGMTEFLMGTSLTADQMESMQMVHSSARSLRMIVEDILSLNQLRANRLRLDIRPFLLHSVIEDACSVLVHPAADKGLSLIVAFEGGIDCAHPLCVASDEARLKQILLNLANNAVKFTMKGQVVLSIRLLQRTTDPDMARLHFTVSDTGIGIPEELQSRIFEPFYQVDTTSTRRFEGNGLGLPISRSLVELISAKTATISVHSKPNVGSVFDFELTLPVHPQPIDEVERVKRVQGILSGVRCTLLLLHDPALAVAIESELRGLGCDAIERASVDCAWPIRPWLQKLHEAAATPAHVVFAMQGDGTRADAAAAEDDDWPRLRELLNSAARYANIAVVVLCNYRRLVAVQRMVATTLVNVNRISVLRCPFLAERLRSEFARISGRSYVSEGLRARRRTVRHQRHLSVDSPSCVSAALLPALAPLQSARGTVSPASGMRTPVDEPVAAAEPAAAPTSVPSTTEPPGTIRVLLVEDVIVNQKVATKLLGKLGCTCTVASHGREGVERFQEARYDLVFMDCQMPIMDGLEATRTIRAQDRERGRPHTHIIGLTGDGTGENLSRCLASGMCGVMLKPTLLSDYQRILREYVTDDCHRDCSS